MDTLRDRTGTNHDLLSGVHCSQSHHGGVQGLAECTQHCKAVFNDLGG